MKRHSMILAAAVMAALSASAAWADEPAKPAGPAAEPEKVAPAPKPDAKPDEAPKPAADQAVDPNAAKNLDTKDLIKDLGGEGTEGQGPEKMLNEVVERMGESAKRLHDSDPGPETQETQRRIVMNLDALIELAKKSQSNSSSQSQSKKPGQQRESNSQQQRGGGSTGGTSAATDSVMPGGGTDPAQSNGMNIHQTGREWGILPEKDRDQIIHGAQEKPIAEYQAEVEKYYQALSELSKKGR